MQRIIYTDLDGTLLDRDTYSYLDAKPYLKLVKEKNVPLIFCTSKTRLETLKLREKVGNTHPFITENGGGILVPKNYFDFDFIFDSEDEKYYTIKLGSDYGKLIDVINELKQDFEIKSFIDMSVEEISEDTKLDLEDAILAKKREYEIPFKLYDIKKEKEILKTIKDYDLNYLKGGRYYHLMGDNSKGKAVEILTELYKKKYGEIFTIGIGDSQNDFSMLDKVDRGYLVMKKSGEYASQEYNPAGEIGPSGWNKVIKKELALS